MLKNVVIPNEERLEELKTKISRDGSSKLHVLADFDKTLTTAFVDGNKVQSTIAILRNENYLTQDYPKRAQELFEKYHPIEINPKIKIVEKKKTMREWWTAHFELLIKSGLNKRDLKDIVNSEKIKLRKGALEFIDFLYKNNIPLIIMSSSGIGDIISMFLEKKNRLYNNVYIISNSFEWDENGNAVEVKQPVIHSMNKDETIIKDFLFYNKIKNRKNVIVIGDNIEDNGMIIGFDYSNSIKIGFLNENIEENLESYKENFDIVLLHDTTMGYVNSLLREMFNS